MRLADHCVSCSAAVLTSLCACGGCGLPPAAEWPLEQGWPPVPHRKTVLRLISAGAQCVFKPAYLKAEDNVIAHSALDIPYLDMEQHHS